MDGNKKRKTIIFEYKIKAKELQMKNKYYNDAIIGGKDLTASYTKNGELLRLMYTTKTEYARSR